MTSKVTEISANTRNLIKGTLESALKLIVPNARNPSEIVERIDELVDQEQQQPGRLQGQFPDEDLSVLLGVAWGEQVVNVFNWSWKQITLDDSETEATVLAVVSPDRSLVLYPIDYVREFLGTPGIDCTIALGFDMLLEKSHPDFKAGELVDFMSGVHRVVPRDRFV